MGIVSYFPILTEVLHDEVLFISVALQHEIIYVLISSILTNNSEHLQKDGMSAKWVTWLMRYYFAFY